MSLVEELREARRYIDGTKGEWVQGKYFGFKKKRTLKDPLPKCKPVGVKKGANCFCAVGALFAVDSEDNYYKMREILDDIVRIEHEHLGGLIGFNDAEGRKEREVLEVFDRAIEIAREREAE